MHQKRREEPPSSEGDELLDHLLGEPVYVPDTDGVYPGVLTSVAPGQGGRVWVEHQGEKEMFRVGRHLLYACHAAAMTHEAGSDPRGHLPVTWGVYLCASKPPLADIILSSVIGLAIPAMSGHIQYRGAAS